MITITVVCTQQGCPEFGIERQAQIVKPTSPVFCSCGAQLNPAAASAATGSS